MNGQQSHFVTTGTSIDGWSVDQYLGVVASHAVAGTGIVSEFFAGFSDIFGGRSKSYRRQLEALYRDTVADLQAQARARGGNWLVGLRMDLDEISGKGVQMFMITGLATAVRAHQLPVPSKEAHRTAETINSSDVVRMVTQLELLQQLGADQPNLSDADWAFLIENRVQEACAPLLQFLSNASNYNPVDPNLPELRQRVAALFRIVPPEAVTEMLHAAIRDPSLASTATALIADCDLGSFRRTASTLRDADQDSRRRALQTLMTGQASYSAESLDDISLLRTLIEDTFPDLSMAIEKKNFFHEITQEWRCQCGKTSPIDSLYCKGCSRDRYGFFKSETSPAKAIEHLAEIQAALSAILGVRTDVAPKQPST